MILKGLALKNFRTYKDLNIEFQKPLTFFVGPNGIGKTNILESLYLLSTTKSFRGTQDRDLVKWHEKTYFVKGKFQFDSKPTSELSVGYNKNGEKHLTLNNTRIKKAKDFFGNIACIIFSPHDIQLIDGPPMLRRRFLDNILSKIEPNFIGTLLEKTNTSSYLRLLTNFNRVHRSRSLLLKKIKKNQANIRDLKVWDKLFIEYTLVLSGIRYKFIESVQKKFQAFFHAITDSIDPIKMVFKSGVGDEALLMEHDEARDYLKRRMEKTRDREVRFGYSLLGSHRDDIQIIHKGKNLSNFASQGQKRSVALALKLSEYEFIKSNRIDPPILLVDDVLGELDIDKKGFFLRELLNSEQALITLTDLELVSKKLEPSRQNWDVFYVKKGRVDSHPETS